MATANFPQASEVYKQMASLWARQMSLSLQAKRKRISIRAEWEKIGGGWQPKGHTKKSFKANYVASGNLIRNIFVEGDGLDLAVSMPLYAQAIVLGRAPMGKSKGGKGIPKEDMEIWAKQRKIRPRNMDTGQFIANTSANKKSMRFLMNRKIKYFGIEPYPFPTHTKEYVLEQLKPKLIEGLKSDIQNLIKKKLK